MSEPPVTITAHGVLDHARAETLAARIRAAVRNDKLAVNVVFESGAVIASANLLAFLLRAAEVLRNRGGRLWLSGNETAIDQLRALGFPAAMTSPPESR